jgi:hypothetical protein
MHDEKKLSKCCNAELNPAGCVTNVGSVDGYCCSKCNKFYMKEKSSTSEMYSHWIKCESTSPQVVKHVEYPTLRDQFAMAALNGLLSSEKLALCHESILAGYSYQHADAMLEARKKNEENT